MHLVGNQLELRLMHGFFSRPYSICGPAARQASWTSGFKAKKAIVSVFVWCAWIKIVRGYRKPAIETLIACDGSLLSRPQPTTSSTCSSFPPRRHQCAQRLAKCALTSERSPNNQRNGDILKPSNEPGQSSSHRRPNSSAACYGWPEHGGMD